MLSVMSTSFALMVKECLGGLKEKKIIREMHISGIQAKFLFSFPYFVQMSTLNWCQKEQ